MKNTIQILKINGAFYNGCKKRGREIVAVQLKVRGIG